MPLQEELQNAVAAHALWKKRLLEAIHSGHSDFSPQVVVRDDSCAFGRWLYGTAISSDLKSMPEYESCRAVHARFHTMAGAILEKAVRGQTEAALSALSSTGDYTTTSTALAKALMEWAISAGDK